MTSSTQKISTVYGLSIIYSLGRLEFCFWLNFFSFYSSSPSYAHLHFCIIYGTFIYIVFKYLIIYNINQGSDIYPNFTDNSWGAAVTWLAHSHISRHQWWNLELKTKNQACTLPPLPASFYEGNSFLCSWFPSFYPDYQPGMLSAWFKMQWIW